jgi:CheY-like chemotaxis protein
MKAGRYVLLAISDNGCGMDSDTISKIFDPFFTTKEIGKGTGLGLATVYGIVKQNGGHIWVYSELNRGTTFKVYLPAADHKVGLAPKSEAERLPPKAVGKTVLLVEDDSLMRRVTRQMLEDHGYIVVEAEDGKMALERLQSHAKGIDVALTDVVMRGMSGPELALELTKLHPAMKVVYMSGYTGELIAQHNGIDREIPLLEKPFTKASLLKTIHAAVV